MTNLLFLMVAVAAASGCMVAAVAIWSENRRKERQEFHRNETYQKMIDGSGESAESVRQLIHEQESRRERRQLESRALGLKMGGWITTVVGLGLGVFLYFLVPDEPIWLVGLLPLLVGLVLILFGSKVESQLGSAAMSN